LSDDAIARLRQGGLLVRFCARKNARGSRNPSGSEYPTVAAVMSDLVTVHRNQGDMAESESLCRRAVTIRGKTPTQALIILARKLSLV
jgi:hypothetical protein